MLRNYMRVKHSRQQWRTWGLLAAFAVVAASASARDVSTFEWEGVPRVVAVGDIHGMIDRLETILAGLELVDADMNWAGGKGHLVFCGDLIDRGPADRAVLDLVRKLQSQAAATGGRVHVLLGNHEVMNLIQDVRYVSRESYAEFAADETERQRNQGWQQFRSSEKGSKASSAELEQAFESKYPPGYFSRVEAFRSAGNYGGWLLEQPAIVKVNGVVFLHGGLTEDVAEMGLERINSEFRTSLASVMSAVIRVQPYAEQPPDFHDLYRAAGKLTKAAEAGRSPPDLSALSAARALLADFRTLPFSPTGPVWYRGNSQKNERVERYVFDAVLESLDARAIVVAHSPTKTGEITSRFNGRFYRTDVGMAYGKAARALVLQGREAAAWNPTSGALVAVVAESPHGEGWSMGADHLPDEQLEIMLREASIEKRSPVGDAGLGIELWELKADQFEFRALHKDVHQKVKSSKQGRRARNSNHEVAAYLLDRKLGLDMVPVAVLRGSGRKPGALRVVIESAIDAVAIKSYRDLEGTDEAEIVRVVAEEHGLVPVDLQTQVNAAWLFDALIANLDRADFATLFVPGDGRLALVNHERAFGLDTGIDASIADRCRGIDDEVEYALMLLDRDELHTEFKEYLTVAQIDAMLTRKDTLLQICSG